MSKSDSEPSQVETPLMWQRLHWGVFYWPVMAAVLPVAWFFLYLWLNGRLLEQVAGINLWDVLQISWVWRALLPWLLLLATPGLVWFALMVVVDDEVQYIVTPRRLLFHTGWLLTNSGELALSQVEAVLLKRPFVGRLLGYGHVIVVSQGGVRYRLRFMPKAGTFERLVREAVEAVRSGRPLRSPSAGLAPVGEPGPITNPVRPSPFTEVPKTPLQQAWEEMTRPLPDEPTDDSRYQPKRRPKPKP